MGKPKQIAVFDLVYGNITAPVTVYESTQAKLPVYRVYIPYLVELKKTDSTVDFFTPSRRIEQQISEVNWSSWLEDRISIRLKRGVDIFPLIQEIKKILQHYFTEIMSKREQRQAAVLPPSILMEKSVIGVIQSTTEKYTYSFVSTNELENDIINYCSENADKYSLEQYFISGRDSYYAITFTVIFKERVTAGDIENFFKGLDKVISEAASKTSSKSEVIKSINLSESGLTATKSVDNDRVYFLKMPRAANDEVLRFIGSNDDVFAVKNYDVEDVGNNLRLLTVLFSFRADEDLIKDFFANLDRIIKTFMTESPRLIFMNKSKIAVSCVVNDYPECVFVAPAKLELPIMEFAKKYDKELKSFGVIHKMRANSTFMVTFKDDVETKTVNDFFNQLDEVIFQEKMEIAKNARTFPDFMYADLVLEKAKDISAARKKIILNEFNEKRQALMDLIPIDGDKNDIADRIKQLIPSTDLAYAYKSIANTMVDMFMEFLTDFDKGDYFILLYPDKDANGKDVRAKVEFEKEFKWDIEFEEKIEGAVINETERASVAKIQKFNPKPREIFALFKNTNAMIKKSDINLTEDGVKLLKRQFENLQQNDIINLNGVQSYRVLEQITNEIVKTIVIKYDEKATNIGKVGQVTWKTIEEKLKEGANVEIIKNITVDDFMAMESGDYAEIVFPDGVLKVIAKNRITVNGEERLVVDTEDLTPNSNNLKAQDVEFRKSEVLNWLQNDNAFIKTVVKANPSDSKGVALPVDVMELESLKSELAQLNFLKSIISPIEFERKIEIGQQITQIEEKINKINFENLERKTKSVTIFDELFNQSFYGLQHQYDSLFADELTDFFAPNGEKSKLNNNVNELIRTPQFIEWFGDWQNAYLYKDLEGIQVPCSQVLSESAEPLMVWHGTGSEFSYFKFDTFPAAYFAVNQQYSQWFADLHGGDGGYTIPFFLNIRNPLDLTIFKTDKISSKDFFDYVFIKTGLTTDELEVNPLLLDPQTPPLETWMYLRNNAKMLEKLSQSHVFDGIHFYETNPSVPVGEAAHSTEVWIAFRGNQIKLADPNRGEILLASLKSFLLEKGGQV